MSVRRQKGVKFNRENRKTQMQQMAEVAERNWLDSWPETMQEEIKGQMDRTGAYKMITRICKVKWRS